MNLNPQPKQPKVSLLVAEVDGTLVTKQKVITGRDRSLQYATLHDAGIAFTITSGQPPLSMKMIVTDYESEGFANAVERYIL